MPGGERGQGDVDAHAATGASDQPDLVVSHVIALLSHCVAEHRVVCGAEVADYAERSAAQRLWWNAQDGRQPGDPDKLAGALVAIAEEEPLPRRFIPGADVIALAERKIADLRTDIESRRDLLESLTFTD